MRERDDVIRAPRTGVFFAAYAENTPLALRANLEHNHTVHETVVVVSLEPLNVPHVQADKRLKLDDLGYEDDGICHVTARYGFQDDIDIPGLLRGALERLEGDVDLERVSYFISRATIVDHRRPVHGPLAQEAVRGDRAQRRQPRRLLQPARRADGRDGRAHRALSAALSEPPTGGARRWPAGR